MVIAWPRWMSMPKYDSTPEMFENRYGLSSVTMVSSQTSSWFSRNACTSSGRMPRARRTWR